MEKNKQELLDLILLAEDRVFLDKLLQDLLTPKEYEEIIKRWQIIRQLHLGISQREISKNLNVSITTVTRGSRVWSNRKSILHQIIKKNKF
ncbi:MAG TPA: Trp family transcriptional regulator [Candidatus Magasanikbacteria bacterium]|nr:Trp family transcriptional regulator [Candidatus Magasanikbacteria bacterium]